MSVPPANGHHYAAKGFCTSETLPVVNLLSLTSVNDAGLCNHCVRMNILFLCIFSLLDGEKTLL